MREFPFLTVVVAVLAIAGCTKGPSTSEVKAEATETTAAAASDPLKSAMSAAPKAVSDHATIVMAKADGSMTTLRAGTNNFTCMPDNPNTPGNDPMCLDANAMTWATAKMNHKPPEDGAPGVIYMLSGGTDASNTDPFASKPTSGGDWIKTGPHVMIVGSAKALIGYPSGANPDTAAPYVMWAGTPYAHLMVPIG